MLAFCNMVSMHRMLRHIQEHVLNILDSIAMVGHNISKDDTQHPDGSGLVMVVKCQHHSTGDQKVLPTFGTGLQPWGREGGGGGKRWQIPPFPSGPWDQALHCLYCKSVRTCVRQRQGRRLSRVEPGICVAREQRLSFWPDACPN